MVNFAPAQWVTNNAKHLSEQLKIYLAEESQLVVSQAKFTSLSQHLTRLHQDVNQAATRLEELEAKLTGLTRHVAIKE